MTRRNVVNGSHLPRGSILLGTIATSSLGRRINSARAILHRENGCDSFRELNRAFFLLAPYPARHRRFASIFINCVSLGRDFKGDCSWLASIALDTNAAHNVQLLIKGNA